MSVSQTSFRAALLDPLVAAPDGLTDPDRDPAGARFSVYRNNVVVSLTEALATAFPLVRKLLGGEGFTRLAGLYVRAYPPSSPLMMHYGSNLPGFLDGFAPLEHIGYLSDCARLDLALRQAYHAADAPAFDATVLTAEDAERTQMSLAPATIILRSDWPLYDIWRFNTEADAPKPRAGAQDVLITRPDFDPLPHLLPVGAADWLEKLDAGTRFGTASQEVMSEVAQFDFTQTLTLALTTHALTEYTAKEI